ncbi:SWI/SNF transcription activation complex subunit [Pseudoloma neurophilia]|uniref:SWI/SNF transcription activation complex subunit n=1 Tax=Pseudoloma neurophilia TaxID=146866 RepID=A0A0R0LWX3_9MICR|nr:SWI/SNF transcription activation complex subunit [Pseudoloma neurophilia]
MPLLSIYEKLRELELHLDKAVLRKKLLIEETHHKRIKCSKNIRIAIKYEKFEKGYHLQIDGRILNNFMNNTNVKFTDIFKNIVVVLNSAQKQKNDSNQQRIFEWNKNDYLKDNIDSFELSGTENHDSLTIMFEFENVLEKYKLSNMFQQLIDKQTDTKTGAIIELWKYIRLNKLISDYNGYIVKCDKKLQEMFNMETFQLIELPDLIELHLLPLDPLFIEIPTDKKYIRKFDIPVELDDFFEFPVIYQNNYILQLDQKIMNLFEVLKNIRTKITTLKSFSNDPHHFINEWLLKHGASFRKQQFNMDHHTFYDPVVQQTIFEMMQCYNRSQN